MSYFFKFLECIKKPSVAKPLIIAVGTAAGVTFTPELVGVLSSFL